MKLLLFAAVLTIFFAIGEAKRCRSGDECAEDECCVARGIFSFRRGDCKKLAQIGEYCSEEQEVHGFFDVNYHHHCPCAAGLSCEPTETKELPFVGTIKFEERCVGDGSHTTPSEPEPETEEPEPEPETAEPEPEPETEEPEPEPETEPESEV
ncbi:unnamed protein product [Larinioides sclopetarius]|uniref:Prokineticin domain-containing protein n=1 Tax=Larinioides sclopetarius TaxID=280406 RepID=A0AAV1YW39_9ARAC